MDPCPYRSPKTLSGSIKLWLMRNETKINIPSVLSLVHKFFHDSTDFVVVCVAPSTKPTQCWPA